MRAAILDLPDEPDEISGNTWKLLMLLRSRIRESRRSHAMSAEESQMLDQPVLPPGVHMGVVRGNVYLSAYLDWAEDGGMAPLEVALTPYEARRVALALERAADAAHALESR